jgi:sugar phosphate isomerase/epimerase
MNFGISLTVALGKEDVLPGADKKSGADLYCDLVVATVSTAKKLGIKTIELVSFPPFDAEVLRLNTQKIKDLLNDFEVLYHLPAWEISPVALNKSIRAAAIQEQKDLVDFAASIGAKQLCMHPASFGAMRWAYGWFLAEIKQNAHEAIRQISNHASEQDIPLNIENLPYKSKFFTQPEDFDGYLDDTVGLVLDTAHAFTAGSDPIQFLNRHKEYVKEVHVVDGFAHQDDTHPPLGEGDINFKEFFSELKKIEYNGPVIIEMMSEEDAIKSLAYLRDLGVN